MTVSQTSASSLPVTVHGVVVGPSFPVDDQQNLASISSFNNSFSLPS